MGGFHAIRSRVLEHLLHQIGTSHRFPEQRFPASLHRRFLRAGADRGKSRAHQNASLLKLGSRHVISSNLPGLHIFEQSAHLMSLHQRMELLRGMRVPLAAQQGVNERRQLARSFIPGAIFHHRLALRRQRAGYPSQRGFDLRDELLRAAIKTQPGVSDIRKAAPSPPAFPWPDIRVP
jgi:hypothetical protein